MTDRAEAATRPPPETDTAAPSGKDTAANSKAAGFQEPRYRAGTRSAMRSSDPDHRAAARVIGYAVVAHDPEIYLIASDVLRLRLVRAERAALAVTTLLAVDEEDLERTLKTAAGCAGEEPHAYLISPLDEATDWARWASDEERMAKCLANFRAMSPSSQREFLAHVGARPA